MTREPVIRGCWLGIKVRDLSALAAIESERSFTGAGNRLGYAQSAISRQIASLERCAGARLVDRNRPVHLTEAGEVVLARAMEALAAIEAAKQDLEGLA